ncbi:PREDICTED: kinetochore-associated protein 1-like [Acropora digitifera]|uniref:kinetochore-associated protein 1-like n=1 Tax=Acropora digitifera TaxID=70779 RepID=UPI00077B1526|nr:PREDICTED: kinetochore-associated protein 1-like [Acropora digitifera]
MLACLAKPTSKLNAGLFDARRREVKPDEMKKQSDSERREENEKPLPEDYPIKLFDSARRENKGSLEKLANSERREETGKPLPEDYPKNLFEKNVTSCPHVFGSSCPEGFCLVASSQVILFDASCIDVHATLNFECDIDCVAWSDDSSFLAIGERSGTFHFVHVASRQILFSQELNFGDDSNKIDCKCTFLAMMFTKTHEKEDSSSLAILSSSGTFTEFSNLHLGKINKGMVGNGDAAIAVWTRQQHNGITLADCISSYILGGSGVKKVTASSNGHFLVVLDDKNMLSLWNVASLTMVAFWSHLSVDDFLLLASSSVQTPGASRMDDDHKLVVLTSANAEALKGRLIHRLSRLLHKQKFSEAERFAHQFNLDIELVYKVKANWLLDQVSPWNYDKNQGTAEEFSLNKLKDCFAQIKVLEALDRLATFEMAFGIENFSGQQWHYFVTTDLLAELTKCLLSGKVTSAVIIWRRHQTQFRAQFTEEKLETLLASINQGLPSSAIIPWLQDDLVPFVSKVLPQGLNTNDELASLMTMVKQLSDLVDLHTKWGSKAPIFGITQVDNGEKPIMRR